MKKEKINTLNFRYSDLLTTLRIISAFMFSLIISFKPTFFGIIGGEIILIIIFITDALDGILARQIDIPSKFGGFYDIIGDRVTEIVLLLPFVYINTITPILPIYFITKGFVIDHIRTKNFILRNEAPYEQSQTKFFKIFVRGRFIRTLYGFTKLTLILTLYFNIFNQNFSKTIPILIYSTLFISILRILPILKNK